MSRQRFVYPATLVRASRHARGEKGFVVSFRDFPEAHSQGENGADALHMAADCLDEAIAARIVADEAIPPPSRAARSDRLVALSGQMAAKAALYLALRESKVSKSALARRLGCDEKDVRRLLDPRFGSKLPRIEAALAALGKRLIIDLAERDAA
ncbi:MAG TPA: type II toxin-antitoxin system HicB family antitoxin [Alphaproteobacteria bacterium]